MPVRDEKEPTRDVSVFSRITEAEHSHIIAISKEHKVTQATVIWWAIRAYLRASKKKSKQKEG